MRQVKKGKEGMDRGVRGVRGCIYGGQSPAGSLSFLTTSMVSRKTPLKMNMCVLLKRNMLLDMSQDRK